MPAVHLLLIPHPHITFPLAPADLLLLLLLLLIRLSVIIYIFSPLCYTLPFTKRVFFIYLFIYFLPSLHIY